MSTETKTYTGQGIKEVTPLSHPSQMDGILAFAEEAVQKLNIEVGIEKVPHTYKNGDFEKVKRITMTLDVPEDFLLQGHEGLNDEIASAVVNVMISEVYGECEAALDELTDEELEQAVVATLEEAT